MAETNYHHGDLKEALLNEAETLIIAGSEKVSLRQLAKAVGVSHTAPYRHFKSWEELQAQIRIRFLKTVHADLEAIAIGQRGSDLKIRDFARHLIQISIQKPTQFAYLSFCPNENPQGLSAANQDIFKLLLKLCVQYLHEKECRNSTDPFPLASTLWTSFFGIAYLAHSGWIPFDKKSIYGEKLLSDSLANILPHN